MDTMKLNKIAAAVLLAGVVAMTTGFVTRLIHPAASGAHHGAADHGDEKRVLAAYAAMGVTLLVGLVGMSLWAWYAAHPMQGFAAEQYAAKGDRIFAIFIVEEVPVGLKGLIMAGVFATAISSLDSILAALSQTVLSAFWLPRREAVLERRRAAGEVVDEEAEARATLALSRKLVLAFAVLLAAVAISMEWVARHYASILDLALAMATYTGRLLAGVAAGKPCSSPLPRLMQAEPAAFPIPRLRRHCLPLAYTCYGIMDLH